MLHVFVIVWGRQNKDKSHMDKQGKRAEGGNCKRVGPSSMRRRRRRRRRIGRRSALELQCVSGFQLFLFSWPRTCPNCVSICPCRIHHFSKKKKKKPVGTHTAVSNACPMSHMCWTRAPQPKCFVRAFQHTNNNNSFQWI